MTLAAIELTGGTATDLGTVDALMRAAFDPRWGEAWTSGQCLGVMALPGVWLTLAHVDGRPAGFALARAVMDEAELLLLAVAPIARGRGIGGALLRAVMADARGRNVVKLHLEVRRGNDAIALYARHGFGQVGERKGYYRSAGGDRHDALTYAREL